MITFKHFIIEAKFSEEDFARVLSAFERRLPKLLGASIHRSGGADGSEKLSGATGYLYFFKTKAFQVREKGGHVLGIDVWDRYSINKGPAYTIDVKDLSAETLLGSMSKLADLIKSPQVGEVPVNESLNEMAKRISADSYRDMAEREFGADALTKLTWAQIKKIADDNDVLIPAYIRDQKVARGFWSVVPGDKAQGGESSASPSATTPSAPAEKTPGKKEPILYIKVTAQDPDSKKFISAAGEASAQKLYKAIQDAVDNAPPTPAEVRDPDTMFGHLAQLSEMAATGKLRSLIVYGGAGTGKTFTITNAIKKAGLTAGSDYVKLSGKASAASIYETLFMFRKGGLVVFDDLDSMWKNQDATNILKAALDTSPVREISWSTGKTINVSRMDDNEREELFDKIDADIIASPEDVRYPSTFDFTGRVIFISNLKKSEFDSAILSRSAKIDMTLTGEQVIQRMRAILPTLGGTDVSLERKEELVDALMEMHKKKQIDVVTMREFIKGMDILRSGASNWRELLVYM